MPIIYDASARTLTLHTDHTTYQMKITLPDRLIHTYYGPRAEGDMSYAIMGFGRGMSGVPMDHETTLYTLNAVPAEYPYEGCGDYRSVAFDVRDADGTNGCDLHYASHSITRGKYSLPHMPAVYADEQDADTLEVILTDSRLQLEVKLLYGVLPHADCITRTAVITNNGSGTVTLDKAASMNVDFLTGDFDRISFYGKHAGERQTERAPVTHTETVIGSRRGQSGPEQNPFIVLCARDATEDHGLCLGAALLWSGSFGISAARDSLGQTRLNMGIQPERFHYELVPGESFTAPEAAMIITDEGLTGMTHRFHRLAHEHVIRSPWRDVARPVLINNWEATYMNFTGEKLISIARTAGELGVDMMVLDDGWFGRRDNDRDGLGDWDVNEAKLGCSMKELADSIKAMGMRFGLWIEPESINMTADLYKAHPEWVFTIPGKDPVLARHQLLLDFSNSEAVDYIFEKINKVISGSGVDYVKMDMNRSLTDVYTHARDRQSQGKTMYKHILGVYDFIQRLLDANPGMLIEGCSAGGGRFDLGMLYYTPQIWTSDNTDPIERLKIQYGTSFAYPPSAMGAHVSVSPNEQTGRITPLRVRGAIAMAGTFGYEMDLNLLSDEEKQEVREQIATFRRYQLLTRFGNYYRLTDCMENRDYAAWMFAAQDKSEALLTIVKRDNHDNPSPWLVRCKGLQPDAQYRDEADGKVYSGSVLMNVGLLVPFTKSEYDAWQHHFVRI